MTAAPAGAHKADAENTDAVANAAAEQKKAAAQARKDAKVATAAQPKPETVSFEVALVKAEVVSAAPEVPAPNTPLPEGEVEVTKDGATESPDGSVLLEPAVVLTAAEHAFLADETLSAALSRVNAQPQNRRSRERSREVTPAA